MSALPEMGDHERWPHQTPGRNAAPPMRAPNLLARFQLHPILYAPVIHTTSQQIALSFALMTACMTPLLWAADNPPSRDSSLAVSNVSQWPRFRGPNGLGLSDADIPAPWTETDYNWKITLPGGGHSSPVVWGDRIFLLCGNDQTGEHMVVCVNAKDGSIRWNRAYPAHTYSHHQYNSYASSSPAVDEKHVYVCWSTPEEFTVMAFDHDGNEIWKND